MWHIRPVVRSLSYTLESPGELRGSVEPGSGFRISYLIGLSVAWAWRVFRAVRGDSSMEPRSRTTTKARSVTKKHRSGIFALEVPVLLVNSRFWSYGILKKFFDPT